MKTELQFLKRDFEMNLTKTSKFIALIIDTMNHDGSVSSLLDPVDRINTFFAKHGHQFQTE